jgi:hypothetical protein
MLDMYAIVCHCPHQLRCGGRASLGTRAAFGGSRMVLLSAFVEGASRCVRFGIDCLAARRNE